MTNIYNYTKADLIYDNMTLTSYQEVKRAALGIMNAIQSMKVSSQILGVAAVLVCMLNEYGISHIDALGIADNIIYSGENNNIRPEFKAITDYMKEEWEK